MNISLNIRAITASIALLVAPLPIMANDYLTNLIGIIKPETSQTAVIVSPLSAPKSSFRNNPKQLFIPASTMKVLTAVASTAALGKDFRFKTQIDAFVGISNQRIEGDVFIRFDGDPTLTSDNLNALLKDLKARGLNHIDGNLYLVGEPQESMQAPGWVWDDLGICYAAPVSRYVINQNCIKATLSPTLADERSELTVSQFEPVTITNSAVFDKLGSQDFCELDLQRQANNQYILSGCFAGTKPLKLAIAISDPARYAQETLQRLLNNNGISLKGDILLTSKRPTNTLLIAEHRSKPLSELLSKMLLKSDNLIADSLLKRLGQYEYGVAGSFTNGSKAMQTILGALGVDLSTANIIDGSGLSRYNLLSAEQLMQVLLLIKKDPKFQYLIDSLPVAGKTGTLEYRRDYRRAPLKGNILAKTGSMMGVSNLAGYIKQDGKLTQAFVVLENGYSPAVKEAEIRPFNVLLLQSIIENSAP